MLSLWRAQLHSLPARPCMALESIRPTSKEQDNNIRFSLADCTGEEVRDFAAPRGVVHTHVQSWKHAVAPCTGDTKRDANPTQTDLDKERVLSTYFALTCSGKRWRWTCCRLTRFFNFFRTAYSTWQVISEAKPFEPQPRSLPPPDNQRPLSFIFTMLAAWVQERPSQAWGGGEG